MQLLLFSYSSVRKKIQICILSSRHIHAILMQPAFLIPPFEIGMNQAAHCVTSQKCLTVSSVDCCVLRCFVDSSSIFCLYSMRKPTTHIRTSFSFVCIACGHSRESCSYLLQHRALHPNRIHIFTSCSSVEGAFMGKRALFKRRSRVVKSAFLSLYRIDFMYAFSSNLIHFLIILLQRSLLLLQQLFWPIFVETFFNAKSSFNKMLLCKSLRVTQNGFVQSLCVLLTKQKETDYRHSRSFAHLEFLISILAGNHSSMPVLRHFDDALVLIRI